jgi:hypothetical protein
MLRYAVFAAAMFALPAMAADTTQPGGDDAAGTEAPAGGAAGAPDTTNTENPAATPTTECPPLFNGVTVDEAADLIRDAGYKARLLNDENGPYIESKAGGQLFNVYFYGCDGDPQRCLQVMFQIRLTTTEEQQKKALEYDVKKVFGRAYNDGDTTYLDYAMHLNGGVTGDYFKNNVDLWKNVVAEFVDYIGW